MEILLATGNLHKKKELEKILSGHTLIMPGDLNVTFEFEETGKTYQENSLGKAMHLHNLTGKPVLADDSGISIPALGGAPGIYSARYGSEKAGRVLTDQERNQYLLTNMKDAQDRSGFFVCCMSLVLSPYRVFTVQETMEGSVTEEPSGGGGFGYDPIFFLKEYGCTVADLPEGEKNRISHRGKAGARIEALLASIEK